MSALPVSHTQRLGPSFAATLRKKEQNNAKFSFLQPGNEHHAYFVYRVGASLGEEMAQAVTGDVQGQEAGKGSAQECETSDGAAAGDDKRKTRKRPRVDDTHDDRDGDDNGDDVLPQQQGPAALTDERKQAIREKYAAHGLLCVLLSFRVWGYAQCRISHEPYRTHRLAKQAQQRRRQRLLEAQRQQQQQQQRGAVSLHRLALLDEV